MPCLHEIAADLQRAEAAYAAIPKPIAPCSDDEVDPTAPTRPISQRDEE